jgi:hypothetical protein
MRAVFSTLCRIMPDSTAMGIDLGPNSTCSYGKGTADPDWRHRAQPPPGPARPSLAPSPRANGSKSGASSILFFGTLPALADGFRGDGSASRWADNRRYRRRRDDDRLIPTVQVDRSPSSFRLRQNIDTALRLTSKNKELWCPAHAPARLFEP